MSVRILHGNTIEVLKTLPDNSIQCCVTSPPYWGLRSYLPDGHADKSLEIGLEKTPAEFVARLVEVFEEVRRVLKPDGVCFVNLGDSYASAWVCNRRSTIGAGSLADGKRANRQNRLVGGLKEKDMVGIPWRVAFALQQPSYSGRIKRLEDRVWLAAIIDGEGCFFIHKRKAGSSAYSKHTRVDGTEANYMRTADTFGVGLEISNTSKRLIDRVAEIIPGGTFTTQGPEQNGTRKQIIYRWRLAPNETKKLAQELYPHLVAKQHQARLIFSCPSTGDAGAAAHQAMKDLHSGASTDVDFPEPPSLFSPGWYLRQDIIWGKPNPMPESVTDRCTKSHEYIFLLTKSARYFWDAEAIKETAVTDDRKRSSWEMRKEHEPVRRGDPAASKHVTSTGTLASEDGRNKRSVWTISTAPFAEAHFATFPPELPEICIKAGSKPGDTVLDPFGGAGTTGLVADRLQRNAILIELNPQYASMASKRVATDRGGLLDLMEA